MQPVRSRKQPTKVDTIARDGGLSTSWADAVEAFLREQSRKGNTPRTVSSYREFLAGKQLATFLTEQNIATAAGFSARHLEDFESELQGAGFAAGTVHLRHMQLVAFLKFTIDRGLSADPSVLTVEAPKRGETAPGIISRVDEARLIKAARCPRDVFLIRFLMGTGLRRAEVLNLEVGDIISGPDGDSIRVRQGKGRKDRVVALDSRKVGFELTNLTAKYLSGTRPQDTDQRAMFLSTTKGTRGDYEPLSEGGLRAVLRRIGEDTGIECNPHRFRHSYATRAIQAGVQPFAVQRLLGHTTYDMVQRYVHYDDQSLKAALN
jgi:site-specific recombinase XerD